MPPARGSARVRGRGGATAEPPPGRADPVPDWLEARVLHRDAAVIVLDKPAGLPVHRGPRGGASLEDWLPLLRGRRRHVPQPAHRLDTDTAGCLALGCTKPALAELGAVFAARLAEKRYWAVVVGGPGGEAGTLDAPLRKVSTARDGWRIEAHPDGQPARTDWRVLGRGGGLAWLELRPRTGRTHQLRVHCVLLGAPILGDPFHGRAAPGGMHLLARSLRLPLDPPREAVAPVPGSMRAGFAACGWGGD